MIELVAILAAVTAVYLTCAHMNARDDMRRLGMRVAALLADKAKHARQLAAMRMDRDRAVSLARKMAARLHPRSELCGSSDCPVCESGEPAALPATHAEAREGA